MSYYHALATTPLRKEAAVPFRAIGRSLFRRGLWGTAARGGEVLAANGGRFAGLGGALQTGGKAMQSVSPYLTTYGMVGMVGEPLGLDLPGSHLALNVGAPGWGAAFTLPGAIRSARLASGKYDGAIQNDVMEGARRAGQEWITATQMNGQAAYDPAAYVRFLQENGIDTESAGAYFGQNPTQRPGMWKRLGNVFENPTGNVIPEVRERIYGQMFKQSSFNEFEKSAWSLLKNVPRAYGLLRAGGTGVIRSGVGAMRVGVRQTAPMQFLKAHPNIGKWGGRAVSTGMLGLAGLDAADAIGSDTPYDQMAVQQEGYDGAQAAIRHNLSNLTPFQQHMARFDPSLAVNALEGRLPGSIAAWEQANGMPYQTGFLGGMQNAWNGRGNPTYYSYDAAGNENYL